MVISKGSRAPISTLAIPLAGMRCSALPLTTSLGDATPWSCQNASLILALTTLQSGQKLVWIFLCITSTCISVPILSKTISTTSKHFCLRTKAFAFRSRISVGVGNFARSVVVHDVVDLLDIDGSCTSGIDYDACMYQALYDKSMAEVGCTVPWLMNKTNICSSPDQSLKVWSPN